MPKKVDKLVGDGNSRSVMWNSLEGWAGRFKLTCGSSVSLTCNQDEETIAGAQDLGATLSAKGTRIMANVMSRKVNQLSKHWDVDDD